MRTEAYCLRSLLPARGKFTVAVRASHAPTAGVPCARQYGGSIPRSSDAAPMTLPLPIVVPSSSTQLAPIHTSSPMTIPPRLGWNPCSRIGRSGSANS